MSAHSINCPDCGKPVNYWQVHCRCEHFLGFPNHRAAAAERKELVKRRDAARADAAKRSAARLLTRLEALAKQSRPVIATSFSACDDILRPGKYRNYDQRILSSEREPAGSEDHSDRAMVGERLFPVYKANIQYAALSPDGRGLDSYGPVAVRWQVTPTYLGRRLSLLEENSFTFYDRHHLGLRGATIPAGHRATWNDRTMLAAAKLATRLTSATSESNLPKMLLNAGATRKEDEFIEIAIYADGGLDTLDVDMVTLQRPPRTREEGYRWELIQEACAARSPSISVIK